MRSIRLSTSKSGRSKSSKQWLQRQRNDKFVRQAQEQGYRSRAAFKLLELDSKDKLFDSGMVVVDLGAAPGGWSQIASERIGSNGMVIAVDLLPIEFLEGVDIIQGDFTHDDIYGQIVKKLAGRQVDLVISDMAPNITGISDIDVPRALYLSEIALDFARECLVSGGCFLVKVFQGQGFSEFVRELRRYFDKVVIRKPEASRAESREVYVLAKQFNRGAL